MKSMKPYVYVVDDNNISLRALQKTINQELDCNVRTFNNAEDCLRMVELREPQLILADYYLDSAYKKLMNGDDLLNKVMEINPKIPVVVYSSTENFKLAVRLIKAGAQDFIPRNIDFIPEVISVLHKQLDDEKQQSFFSKIWSNLS